MNVRILGLCGSLRAASKNRIALEVAQKNAPAFCELRLWDGLAWMPPFSPDLDQPGRPLPRPVAEFHAQVDAAEGLLIACPEYAHGLPGAFKNALDWLVGSVVFPGKQVALLNVAPHAAFAKTQLREVLTTMSGDIVESASCALAFPKPDDTPARNEFECVLRASIEAFANHLQSRLRG